MADADATDDGKLIKNRKSRTGKRRVRVTRPIYTESDFQKQYLHIHEEPSNLEKVKKKIKNIEVSPKSVWHCFLRLFPIFKWLPAYNFQNDIIGDIISGITVAVMRIPQAMAYAILATLPAVYGLYVAFFSVLVYAVLGTSKHISIGTWSIASIMTGDAIETIVRKQAKNKPTVPPGDTNGNDDETELRVQVAVTLALLVGIIQFAMGVFRLGIVTIYLSEPLIKGFTTGAAVHVFTSQFPKLFGVKVQRYNGPLAQVYTYIDFFSKLPSVNTCAIIMSILSLLLLIAISEVNDRQAAKGWCRPDGTKGKRIPLPSELLVVIIATAVSYCGDYENVYSLPVVGDIPTGLPSPTPPSTQYMVELIGPAFAIAIVSFAISISMAQLFAKIHNYEVDANQELIAYGSTHLFGAFFQCFPNATAMSRTAVQEGAGGRTQLAGIISSGILLVILLWLGPLFTQLPECVLASIIVVALRGMFRQFPQLRLLWKVSLVDFLLWLMTFLLVVLMGVDLGLLLGVIFALITVVVRSQSPYCALMGRIPHTEIYRDIAFVQGVEELSGIKIFQFSASLSFINAIHFRDSLYEMVGVNPKLIMIARAEHEMKLSKSSKQDNDDIPICGSDVTSYTIASDESDLLHTVIIECSLCNYLDVVGVKTLQEIVTDYEVVSVRVIFAKCNAAVRKALLTTSFINKAQEIGLDRVYVSLHDAVLSSVTGAISPTPGSFSSSQMD